MYLGRMTCDIWLADTYRLRGANGIEIKKSIHQVVQTAKVQLPLSVLFRNSEMLERIRLIDKVKEGDAIKISFGYNGNNRTEFTGYIRKINYKQPLMIECEDEMYLFRKVMINKIWNNVELKTVLTDIISEVRKAKGVSFELFDKMPQVVISNFICKGQTALWVLNKIADLYPVLAFYMTDINGKRILYAGLKYGETGKPHVKYSIGRNTISVDNLNYNGEAEKVKVIYEIRKANGEVVKKEFGDRDAETTVNKKWIGDISDETLKLFAESELTQKTYTGYRGNIEAFIFPLVEPAMIADIDDPQFSGRDGAYFIGTVTTSFTTSGGKRMPEIEFRVK